MSIFPPMIKTLSSLEVFMAYRYGKFSDHEISWVRENHPALRVREFGALLRGHLDVDARYPYHNSPMLKCEYQIKMRIGIDFIPYVWETGGYLQARAKDMRKELIDMHVHTRPGYICMGTPIRMRRIIQQDRSIRGVFDNLIIPYFYYHTYWKKYGVEPWPGLAHDEWGFCQDYLNNCDMGVVRYLEESPAELTTLVIQRQEIHAEDKCPCGCGKAKQCRCGAVDGFNALKRDYHALSNEQKKSLQFRVKKMKTRKLGRLRNLLPQTK